MLGTRDDLPMITNSRIQKSRTQTPAELIASLTASRLQTPAAEALRPSTPRVCNVKMAGLPKGPPVGGFSPARSPAGHLMDWERRFDDGTLNWKRIGRRRVGQAVDNGAGAAGSGATAEEDRELGSCSSAAAASVAASSPRPFTPGLSCSRRNSSEPASPRSPRVLGSPPRVPSLLPSVAHSPPAPLTHGPGGVGFLDANGVLHYRRRHQYLADSAEEVGAPWPQPVPPVGRPAKISGAAPPPGPPKGAPPGTPTKSARSSKSPRRSKASNGLGPL